MQSAVRYVDQTLYIEEVALEAIAQAVGTPTYVYSKAHITAQFEALTEAFSRTPTAIHYAVKANSNLAILSLLGELGAGFDIVSGGELHRVLAAGCDPQRVVFSGVGKQSEEIDLALRLKIACFNVESEAELERIAQRAELNHTKAPISIRVNPNVDAQTHPYISTGLQNNKFGVPPEVALSLYQFAHQHPHLEIAGIDCHIGSQITDVGPLLESLASILAIVDELKGMGISLEHIDLGGGMGIDYGEPGDNRDSALNFADYGAGVNQMMAGRPQKILLEPGRSLVANAGVLLARVEYLKPATGPDNPNFAVVDAAMNDLLRPALYQAWHEIVEVRPAEVPAETWQVVGPVCETGDFLGHDRALKITEASLVCIGSAGAYGMVQASNYNTRGRAAEVLVDGDSFSLVRRRETIEDQLRLERVPAEQKP
ncbi:MAG: diaminopimelate decarboxylase [Pseudomonadales bacterium]